MRILLDREGDTGRNELDRFWETPESFALLPGKSGPQAAWVARLLADLPESLQEGHFALFSSGSTGEPRLVFGSRERAERLTHVLHEVQASEPVRLTISLLPLTYSYAFVNQWLWARVLGRDFQTTSGFAQPQRVGEALARAERAMVCLVAAHVPLFESHFSDRSFPGVIRVHFAGSRFPQERLSAVRRRFPHADIYNNYGCIEAMPRLSIRRAEESDSAADIGHPLPGVELRTLEEGRLFFRSPYSAVAFCDAAGHHAIEPEDWVPTQDLGHRRPDGRWHLDGRASEVFKRYGVKISLPILLDSLSSSWAGQSTFYCEVDSLGETGHVLLLAPRPAQNELREILSMFRRVHARMHWPLRIESVPVLPLLPNGKVNAGALAGLPEKRVEWNQRI